MNNKKEMEIMEDVLEKLSFKIGVGNYEDAERLSRIYMNLKIGEGNE